MCIARVNRQSNVLCGEVRVSALLARLHCLTTGEYFEKTNMDCTENSRFQTAKEVSLDLTHSLTNASAMSLLPIPASLDKFMRLKLPTR